MNVTIKINGMHCAACSGRVQRALSALNGVDKVSVSLENGTATISAKHDIPMPTLRDTVEQLGFEVAE